VVIDTYAGVGTTGIAGLRLGASKVILLDVNQKYLAQARERIGQTKAAPHAPMADPIRLGEGVTLHPGDCRHVILMKVSI
jgi:DNA modification methylase